MFQIASVVITMDMGASMLMANRTTCDLRISSSNLWYCNFNGWFWMFFFKPASAFEILKEVTVLFFEFLWSEVFDFIPYRSAHSLWKLNGQHPVNDVKHHEWHRKPNATPLVHFRLHTLDFFFSIGAILQQLCLRSIFAIDREFRSSSYFGMAISFHIAMHNLHEILFFWVLKTRNR